MLGGSYNNGYRSPLDDPRGFRKSNKFAKQLGKLSPFIALVLLISLLGTLAFHTTKVSRLGREAVAAQSNVQAVRGELLQSQRASENHRELAQQRLRHADALRVEMESVRGRLRSAEEDSAHKQALISHNNHQIEQLNKQVQELQTKSWQASNCQSELEMLKVSSEHTRRSLTEKETAGTEKDRQVAELQRQVAELQAKIGGTSGGVGSTGIPPAVPDSRAGWSDPRGAAAGVSAGTGIPSPPPSQLSKEAHAGFAHVASMLAGQGIVDPAGEQHLTSVLVDFFEARMANLIGAEFHDPQSSGGQPLHEELYTKLITAGIYSVHGRDHMISTVRHMVDALGHGTPAAADQAHDMVGRGVVQSGGDAQQGHATAGIGRKDLGGVDTSAYAQQQQQHHGTAHPGWQQHEPAAHGAPDPQAQQQHDSLHHGVFHRAPEQEQKHKPDAAGFIY